MREHAKTVALLVANPALSSILAMTLAGVPSLRVRPFETEMALRTYLHITPAELVVADFDCLPCPADMLASHLRADHALSRQLQIIALAGAMSPEVRAAALQPDIDEILLKPMSPRYLVERVLARLGRIRARTPRGLYQEDWSRFGGNVVPLFGPAGERRP